MDPSKKQALFKVLSLNAVQVGVNFVLGFLSVKITSVLLGTTGMALTGSLRNFVAMMKSLATLGISNSAVKLVAENRDDKAEMNAIYATFFWFALLLSVVLGLVTIAFSGILSSFLFFESAFIWPLRLFGAALPLVVLNVFWIAVYNGFEQFRKIILIQIVSNVVVFAATVSLIYYHGLEGGLYAIGVGEMLMAAVTWFFFRKDRWDFRTGIGRIIHTRYLKQIAKFMLMGFVTAVLAPCAQILIRNLIVDSATLDNAGIWDAVHRISGFYMLAVNSGLSLYYLPRLAALKDDSGLRRELKYYYSYFVPLFLLAATLLFLFRELAVTVAMSSEFLAVKDILVWQLAADTLKILSLGFSIRVLVSGDLKRYMIGEIGFNVLYLVGAYYWVPLFSAQGALMAGCVANGFYLGLMLFWFRRTLFRRNVG